MIAEITGHNEVRINDLTARADPSDFKGELMRDREILIPQEAWKKCEKEWLDRRDRNPDGFVKWTSAARVLNQNYLPGVEFSEKEVESYRSNILFHLQIGSSVTFGLESLSRLKLSFEGVFGQINSSLNFRPKLEEMLAVLAGDDDCSKLFKMAFEMKILGFDEVNKYLTNKARSEYQKEMEEFPKDPYLDKLHLFYTTTAFGKLLFPDLAPGLTIPEKYRSLFSAEIDKSTKNHHWANLFDYAFYGNIASSEYAAVRGGKLYLIPYQSLDLKTADIELPKRRVY